jgi:hypothetical protein
MQQDADVTHIQTGFRGRTPAITQGLVRKWSWPDRGNTMVFVWRDWGKPRDT